MAVGCVCWRSQEPLALYLTVETKDEMEGLFWGYIWLAAIRHLQGVLVPFYRPGQVQEREACAINIFFRIFMRTTQRLQMSSYLLPGFFSGAHNIESGRSDGSAVCVLTSLMVLKWMLSLVPRLSPNVNTRFTWMWKQCTFSTPPLSLSRHPYSYYS